MTWRPCLKQQTTCIVSLPDGRAIVGMNRCDVPVTAGVQECPRVLAGCATGEGYEMCGPPIHAEVDCADHIPEGLTGLTARLYGHNWFCGPCQWALQEKGVRTFVVTGEPS